MTDEDGTNVALFNIYCRSVLHKYPVMYVLVGRIKHLDLKM